MKKLTAFSGGLALLVSLTCNLLLNGCMAQMSESVMDAKAGFNGSFEQVQDHLPVNWLVYTPKTTGEGDFDLTFDQSDFKEGHQSLKFTVRKCSARGGRFSPGIAQEIPVRTGEVYEISFWIKNKGTTFSVKINGASAKHQSEGPKLNSSENIATWQKFTYSYTIPPSMNKLRFEASILGPGIFQVDDIRIEQIN